MAAEQLDQLILGAIGILKLVHQNEAEPVLIGAEPVGMLPEERERVEQQIIEIHRVCRLQRGPQGLVDLRRYL